MKKITSPFSLKKALFESIGKLMENKDGFFENPRTDFSRIQKISLHDTMLFPMVISNEKTAVEMLDYFPTDALPSQSAMSYRRDQLKVAAYEALFKDFTSKLSQNRTFHGLRVIACDGTRLNTPYNPKDTESFVDCIEGRKGFNQYHLITCYDVLNEVFTDAVIQGYYSMNEKLAFCTMLDRYPTNAPFLFVCDRGFASYNTVAHVQKNGHFFLIRLTAPMAHKIFPDTQDIEHADVLDVVDTYYIGRIRNKESKQLKNYHFKNSTHRFDFIPVGSKRIESYQARLVKFPLPSGEYEYLLTNLPQEKFTLSDLKKLYQMRWGVEISYRYLKYASGMVYMHSIKQKFLFQEIFAKLTLYNFCTAVKKCLKKTSDNCKHKYVTEKTYLIKSCIRFLKNQLEDIIDLVENKKVPVRADRTFSRNLRRRHANTLQYR